MRLLLCAILGLFAMSAAQNVTTALYSNIVSSLHRARGSQTYVAVASRISLFDDGDTRIFNEVCVGFSSEFLDWTEKHTACGFPNM